MDELKVIYEDMVKELIYDANHKRVKTSAGYEVTLHSAKDRVPSRYYASTD